MKAIERAIYRGRRIDNGECVESTSIVNDKYTGKTYLGERTGTLHITSRGLWYNVGGFVEVDPETVGQLCCAVEPKIFEGDRVTVSGSEYYSNNQFNIEPMDDEDRWELAGTVKIDEYMWVVEIDDKSCIPFCDVIHNELIVTIHDERKTDEDLKNIQNKTRGLHSCCTLARNR